MVDPSAPRRWWRRKRVILPALVVIGLLAPLPVSWMVHLAGWRAYDRAVAEARAAGLPTTMAEWAAQQPAFADQATQRWIGWLRDRAELKTNPDWGTDDTAEEAWAEWKRTPQLPAPATAALLLPALAAALADLKTVQAGEIPPGLLTADLALDLRRDPDSTGAKTTAKTDRGFSSVIDGAVLLATHGGDIRPLVACRHLLSASGASLLQRLLVIGSQGPRESGLLRIAWQDRLPADVLAQVVAEPVPPPITSVTSRPYELPLLVTQVAMHIRGRLLRGAMADYLSGSEPGARSSPWTWLGDDVGGWSQSQWRTWVAWTQAGWKMAASIEDHQAKLSGRMQSATAARPLDAAIFTRIDDLGLHLLPQHLLTRAAIRLLAECRRGATMPSEAGQAAWLVQDPRLPLTYRQLGPERMRIQLAWPPSAEAAARLDMPGGSTMSKIDAALTAEPEPMRGAIHARPHLGFIDLRWPVPGVRSEAAASATAGRMP